MNQPGISQSQIDFPVHNMLNPFKYHSVEARRLWEVTVAGLELNGISTENLDEQHEGKFVLRGSLRLSPYSLALIPPHLGGTMVEAPTDMTDRTISFIDAINAGTPSGYKGPSAP
jgi:hypothetical protein